MPNRSSYRDTRVIERRHQVAARYLRGEQQYDISRALGVTQAQISMDLKAIRDQWLASSLRDFDALRAEQLARIDAIEAAAWASWERSKQDREITVTEATEGEHASRKARVRKEGQAGDPRFLAEILKCVERRCAILGLDAPKRYKVDWDALSDAQLARLAAGDDPLAVLAEA